MECKDSKALQESYDKFREQFMEDSKIRDGVEPYKMIVTESKSLRECLELHKDMLGEMFKGKYIPQGDTVIITSKKDGDTLYEACTFLIYAHFKR